MHNSLPSHSLTKERAFDIVFSVVEGKGSEMDLDAQNGEDVSTARFLERDAGTLGDLWCVTESRRFLARRFFVRSIRASSANMSPGCLKSVSSQLWLAGWLVPFRRGEGGGWLKQSPAPSCLSYCWHPRVVRACASLTEALSDDSQGVVFPPPILHDFNLGMAACLGVDHCN